MELYLWLQSLLLLFAAKVLPIVKNEILLLGTLLIAKSLAMEVGLGSTQCYENVWLRLKLSNILPPHLFK